MKTQYRRTLVAGLIAAAAAGSAFAGGGDNGMNPFYGDSWAELEGHGANLGGYQRLPGAYAYLGTGSPAFDAMTERLNRAESALSERLHHATDAMAAQVPRNEASAPVHVSEPMATTPADPFEDKGGN